MTGKNVLLIGSEPERMTRLRRTFNSLKRLGVNVQVFKPYTTPRGQPKILTGIVRYLAISLKLMFSQSDVYHFFNVPDIIGLFLVPKRGMKVYDVRSPWFSSVKEMLGLGFLSRIAEIIERLLTLHFDLVLTANTPLAERAWDWGARRVIVVPNYPPKDFAPTLNRRDMRKELRLGYQKTVLYLGRISRLEGSELLKQIMADCLREDDISFLIVGDGPERSSLFQFIHRNGFSEQVRMVEWVPHNKVANYINAADICLLPREWTSFSPYTTPENILKVGEYLAVGKPVVVPKMGGFRDAEFPVIAVEPSKMAEAVLEFLSDPREVHPSERPSWDISHQRLKKIYSFLGALPKG